MIAEILPSVLVFVVVGICCRFALYYFNEGIALFSMVNAILWTTLSAVILIPLYRFLGATKGAVAGVLVYGLVFFILLSYAFVIPSLTLKVDGNLVFQEGHITNYGMTRFLMRSVYDSITSLLSLLALIKFDSATAR